MIKKTTVVATLFIITIMHGQKNTASPYSFYALGDIKFKGVIENRMMGGLSIYADSIHLNIENPASYANLKLTTYSAAGSYDRLILKNENSSENASAISFDYLSLGFPISKKIGVGLGLLPYTAVGYQLESVDDSQPQSVTNRYTGEGGLNRVYFSLGYAITNELSVGITGNYDFGKLQNENIRITEDVQLATKEINRSNINGLDFNFAVNYRKLLNKKYTFYLSFLYTPETKVESENFRTISTIQITTTGAEIVKESEDVDLSSIGLKNIKLILPYSSTFGLGLGKEKKWFIGTEYGYRNMSVYSNPFIDVNNYEYENAYNISVGGFYIPKYDSFTNYWNRVVYRAGVRYEKTGLRLNANAVNNFGIAFGVGLPLGGYVPNTNSLAFASLFSNINLGIDIGKRGTTDFGIQENYFNLTIGLSLNDKWFVKRKYD